VEHIVHNLSPSQPLSQKAIQLNAHVSRARRHPPRQRSGRASATHEQDEHVARLRDAIVQHKFLPNQRITEAELASFLGASRRIARTALERLEYEGLVVRERNRGAHVRLITDDEAIQIVELRSVIEGLAARYAALRATPRDVKELRDILKSLRATYLAGDLLKYAEINQVLHATIFRIGGQHIAANLLRNLQAQSVSFLYRSVFRPGRAEESMREHRAIVDAIAAKRPVAAELGMRKHLDGAVVALRKVIKSRGDSNVAAAVLISPNSATLVSGG
jgi:DNA-binding GntR family transcriptional regulator